MSHGTAAAISGCDHASERGAGIPGSVASGIDRHPLGLILGADLDRHLHFVGGQIGEAPTRERLQAGLEQHTERQASAIKSDRAKIPGKQVGQVLFAVQALRSETGSRKGAISLLGRRRPRRLLGPRYGRDEQRETRP